MPQARSGTVTAPGVESDAVPEGNEPQAAPPAPVKVKPLSPEEIAERGENRGEDPEIAKARELAASVTQGGPARERVMHEAAVERPELHPSVAHGALELMLSSEPPPIEQETYRIRRLTEHYRELGVLPTPEKEDDSDDPKFHFFVTLRGLTDVEFEQLGERALREPTKEEQKMGILAKVRDPRKMEHLMVTVAMVEPNIRDPALLERFHRPQEVISHWFVPGEIQQLAERVNDLSGWGSGAVERAKKS